MSESDVLVERLEGLKALIAEKFNENDRANEKILAQTTATNGKVASLVEWRIKINLIVSIISITIGSVALPILVYWIKSKLHL